MVKKNTLRKGINNFFEGLNLFNNKSAKKSYNGILIIAGILGVMFLINFAVADSWISHSGALTPDGTTTGAVLMYAVVPSTGGLNFSIYTNSTSVNLTINEAIINTVVINLSLVGAAPAPTINNVNGSINEVNITFDQSFTVTLLNPNGSIPIADANVTFAPAGGVAFYDHTNKSNFSSNTLNGRTFSWFNRSIDGLFGNFTNAGTVPNNATFRFNISGAVPGTYNITILLANSSARNMTSNFTIIINDTTAPNYILLNSNSTGFSSITPIYFTTAKPATTSTANLSTAAASATTIYVSVNITDFNETGVGGIGYAGQRLGNISIVLYNETGLVNLSQDVYRNMSNMTAYATGSNNQISLNFSALTGGANLSEGRYLVTILNISDVGNNKNESVMAYNITIDGTAPTLTVAKASTSTKNQIVLDLTVSDATSGIAGKQCTTTGGGNEGITMSGNIGAQTATQTGLGCNTAYTYTTSCTDHSGNTKSSSVTVSTDGCTGGSSGGSGGSGSDVVGSSTSDFWVLTYNEASTDLNGDTDGVSVNLDEQYRVKIKVDTKLYYVGVTETTDTTAKLNVTTTAEDKEATLNVGEIKKFDVNADNKYDISVTLNGVDSATGKADLSLVYIQEPVSAEDQAGVEEQVGEVPTTTSETKSKTWIWVIVILVVLAIAAAILFGKKQSKHKNYGF